MPNPKDIIDRFASNIQGEQSRIYNLKGSSAALFFAVTNKPFVAVAADDESCRRLMSDTAFYRSMLGLRNKDICFLPPPNGPKTAGERAMAVWDLFSGDSDMSVITTAAALESSVHHPDHLTDSGRGLILQKGREISRDEATARLHGLGYERAPLVAEPGQYGMRGYILDVFPSTSEQPFRVEFFGDTIDSIRIFEIDTQRSVSETESIRILPAAEPADGISLKDYITGRRVYYSESVHAEMPPDAVALSRLQIAGEGMDAGALGMSGIGLLPEERGGILDLPSAIKDLRERQGQRVIIVASSSAQAERLMDIMREAGEVCPQIHVDALVGYERMVSVTVGNLSEGLWLPGLAIITELEMFGGRPAYRPLKKSKLGALIESIDDLTPGDFVVHVDRGIGKFEGLVRRSIEGSEYDMVMLGYAGGDRIYLPLYAIDKIRKYRAEEGVRPELEKLGAKKWQKTRERVKKRIMDMAAKLIKLYAERESEPAEPCSPDGVMHSEFDDFFPYEETPDQLKATIEIKRDMEGIKPMDRLLCGDVGYGKTEVAMKAAFKAVFDGRQVAVLVPTTILCEQHLRIFKKRFAAFPVRIDNLSRFKSKAERSKTLERVKNGEVDIIISTHALLRSGAGFQDLGLLIIDEEHRFGVRQKEKIKELKKGVHVLSMSATPIPRTLQMSLSGIRSMSLIETPPEEREAVRTTVAEFSEVLIKQAIGFELERGGQVFYVHNRIKDIHKVADMLKRAAPNAKTAIAHGQMPEAELEDIMLRFLDGRIDLLLCTAIIGAGIDVPTANTIVIDMADKMGLADLYQLRGRVGRGNTKAYAYLIAPKGGAMTDEARRRLEAIQELSYMGAGVRLAMKDLEIRGAGNLLGAEQSGSVNDVGFDLYMEMLESAVAELKGMPKKEKIKTAIDIGLAAFIPEEYVDDITLRLSLYRRISACSTDSAIESLRAEIHDRFGKSPDSVNNLLDIRKLGIAAESLMITSIKAAPAGLRFALADGALISADAVLKALGGDKVRFMADGFMVTPGKSGVVGEIASVMKKLQDAIPAAA